MHRKGGKDLQGRMQKNTYLYEGKEFTSIKALSEYTKIHEKTLTARLRRGMSVEQACVRTDFRCVYYAAGEEKKSLAEICRDNSKNTELVRNRLVYGYDLSKALNTPKKVTRQGRPVVVKGILYNSISDALRKLNLTHKENIVRSRLHRGKNIDEAFCFEE